MNQFMILLLLGVTTLCSARYLPKKEFIKNTPEKWEEVAKKIGLSSYEAWAAIDLMTLIQNEDIDSAEMDTNTQWKKSMLTKCKKLALNDDIDKLEDKVGDIKWSDVENKTLSEKLDYWNSQYMTLTCEHAKMKTLKNICILITQDETKRNYLEQAKLAGLPDEQIEPMANVLLKIDRGKSIASKFSIWADNCDVLKGDGELIEIDEKYRGTMNYSDVANKNVTMKLQFWRNFARRNYEDCGDVCVFKAMKNFCVEFMSPVERKKIEDAAKQAGFEENDIPIIVDIEMRMNAVYYSPPFEINRMLLENFEKLGNDQQLMNVPSTETELEKLQSENLSEKDLGQSFDFWKLKYYKTAGVDHLKSLNNLCVILMKMKPLDKQN